MRSHLVMKRTLLLLCLVPAVAFAEDPPPAPPAEPAPPPPPPDAKPPKPPKAPKPPKDEPADAAPNPPETPPTDAPPVDAPPTEAPPADAPPADPVAPDAPAESAPMEITVGLHVGPTIPLSALGVSATPRLEVGLVPGMLKRQLQFVVTGSFAAPVARGTVDDPRVPGGSYDWELHQSEVILGIGAIYDLLPRSATVHPEVEFAPQLYILGTRVDGTADANAFGESKERYVQPGLLVAAGVGYYIGPGRLIGRVEFEMSPLIGEITGKSSTAAINPTVGYRLYF